MRVSGSKRYLRRARYLGIDCSTVYRVRKRFEEEGEAGLFFGLEEVLGEEGWPKRSVWKSVQLAPSGVLRSCSKCCSLTSTLFSRGYSLSRAFFMNKAHLVL